MCSTFIRMHVSMSYHKGESNWKVSVILDESQYFPPRAWYTLLLLWSCCFLFVEIRFQYMVQSYLELALYTQGYPQKFTPHASASQELRLETCSIIVADSFVTSVVEQS